MNLLLIRIALAAVLIGAGGIAQAGLLANWPFDEPFGATKAVDVVGGHHGAIDAASPYKPSTGAAGKIGKAYSFVGGVPEEDFETGLGGVAVPNATVLSGMRSLTVSVWIYQSHAPPGDEQLLYNGRDAGPHAFELQASNYGEMWGLQTHNGAEWNEARFNKSRNFTYGEWHLLTATYDGTTGVGRVYLDGVLKGEAATTPNRNIAAVGCSMFIGCGKNGFRGRLDDPGVFDEALGEGHVKALYSAPTVFAAAAAAGRYGLKDMQALFDLHAARRGTVSINGKTWQYSAAGFDASRSVGQAWVSANRCFLKLGRDDGLVAIDAELQPTAPSADEPRKGDEPMNDP